jgi:hypothetical protein
MRTLIISMLAVVALVNCMPCETADAVDLTPTAVCHRADAGTVTANVPFTVFAETYSGGNVCNVSIDGGSIRLDIPSSYAVCNTASGGAAAAPRGPIYTPCEIPALDAGTWVIQTNPPTTFTLPTGDAGIPDCR